MKKVISFSLWGDDPKYCVGAVKNAELVKAIYPGWEMWVYVGSSVPSSIKDSLKRKDVILVEKEEYGDWTSTFWRFEPIAHPDVSIMISRDTDSRLSMREKYAVDEWMSSKKLFHVMRDHPAHAIEILAGMWGAKKPILGDMLHLIEAYKRINTKQADQNFLKEVIWPRVAYTTCTHDDFFAKSPFPTSRVDNEFVGDVFNENDERHPEYWKDIKKLGAI